ncbi:MAG: hypothetical protein BGP06_09385 [Rhizobiales bacterium 65-9]|nr:hypothetical protein [Hyphomicrobiales bacterium]OJY38670.1 MAG: hypothetical protein BGP06_09385 [Rhizobiales bacterium 65-9]
MAKILEAKAIISAEDKTGAAFQAIAKKIEGVAKAAKSSAEIDRFSKAIGAANTQAKGLAGVSKEIDKLKVASEKIAAPLRGFSADMERQIRTAKLSQGQIRDLSRDWIRMQHEQARALSSIGNPRIRQQMMDADMANMVSRMRGRVREMQQLNRMMRESTAPIGGGFRHGLLPLVGGVGGFYATRRLARATGRAAAESAREGSRDYLAGLTPQDEERLRTEAQQLSSRFPSLTATTMHERLRDTAMSMGSIDKASAVSDALARSMVVLQTMKGRDKALEENRQFMSALDVLGKNVDPAQVRRLLNGYVKAIGVEGADLDMGGLLQMARMAKSGGAALSEKFLMTTAPALMMDSSPQRLGTALGSEVSQVIGGRATKASKAYQAQLGLRDKKGNFNSADRDLILSDPFEYSETRLIPALKKAGIDVNNDTAVIQATSKAFSNQMVADLFAKLIIQREQYIRKRAQYEKAPGLDAADVLPGKDPNVAVAGAGSQLTNLLATLADPLLPAATAALNMFAAGVAQTNKALLNNPETQKAASAATAGFVAPLGAYLTGLGLKSAGGAIGGWSGGVAGWAGSAMTTLGGLGTLLGGGVLGSLFSAGQLKANPEFAKTIANNSLLFGAMDPNQALAAAVLSRAQPSTEPLPFSWPDLSVGPRDRNGKPAYYGGREAPLSFGKIGGWMKDAWMWSTRGNSWSPVGGNAMPPIPPAPPLPAFAQPMPAPTMSLAGGNTAVPRIAQAGFGAPGQGAQQVDVKGTVEGQAKIDGTLKIEPSPLFQATFSGFESRLMRLEGQVRSGNAGTTGSQTP